MVKPAALMSSIISLRFSNASGLIRASVKISSDGADMNGFSDLDLTCIKGRNNLCQNVMLLSATLFSADTSEKSKIIMREENK